MRHRVLLTRRAREPRVRITDRLLFEVLAEGFNRTDRGNVVTRNTNFGAGVYPTNPSPAFGQITAVGEPRSMQLGLRMRF